MCRGVKYRFYKSHNFRKFIGFWCGYGCIKRDKTDFINSDEILKTGIKDIVKT